MDRPIAILLPDLQGGGAQRQAAMLARQWSRHGRSVTILTYEPPGLSPFFPLPEDVRVMPLDLQGPRQSVLSGAGANLKRIRAVRKALQDTGPSVLLAFLPEMAVIGWAAARPLRLPVIACERTDPSVYPTGIWRVLRNLAYPRCERVVCQSVRASRYLERTCRTAVIPNAVVVPDSHAPSDVPAPPGRFIASLGRLSPEKGHDVLIEAFARIAPDFHDVDLLLIGEGPARGALEKLVHARGLQDRVHMPGAAKAPFATLAEAALFVLPSRFEGFPNALAEAMALGLPCIATEGAAGTEGLVRDKENGWLVPNEDPAAMAAAIRECFASPEQSARLGENARNIAIDYSPEKTLAQWDALVRV